MKILFTFIMMFLVSPYVHADFENSNVKIEYFEIDENGDEYVIGSSGWDCEKSSSMSSIYYKTLHNGIGISGGNYVDYDDVIFEMPYNLRLTKHPDRMILRGVFRAFNLQDSTIMIGIKKNIYQDIEYNKPISFLIKLSEKESATRVVITLRKNEPMTEVVYNGPISLITNFTNNSACVTNTQGAITDKIEFRTGNSKKRDDGYIEHAKLLTEILIPNYPEELTMPFQTELIFKRIYKIDTLYVSEREFNADVTYTSEYKKKVELIPGKTLVLVFPPDTPSVRGLDREDTLIIKP